MASSPSPSASASLTRNATLFLTLTLTLTLILTAFPAQTAAATDAATDGCYKYFQFVPGTNYSTCATLKDNSTLAWSLTYDNNVDKTRKYMEGLYVSNATTPGGWVSWGFNMRDKIAEMENSVVLACYNTADGPKVFQLWLSSTEVSGVTIDTTNAGGKFTVTGVICTVQSWSMDGMAMETVYIQFNVTLGAKAQYVNVYAKGPTGTTKTAEGTLIKGHSQGNGMSDRKIRDMRITSASNPGLIQPIPPPPPPASTSPPPPSPPPPTASCSRTNSLTPTPFDTCRLLDDGSLLQWSWNATTSVMRVAFSKTANPTTDYISWGINEDGLPEMEPSSVIVCFQRNGAMTGTQYYLADTSDSGVSVGGKLTLTNLSCGSDGVSKISLAFDVVLSSPNIATIWATGKVEDQTNYIIAEHCSSCRFASALKDFSDYALTLETAEEPHKKFKNIHGFLSAIGWGIIIPLGAMVARYVKPFAGPAWLNIHRVFQTSGYLLGLGGFAMGIRLHYWGERDDRHLSLAIAITVIGSLQVLSSLIKPDVKAKNRLFWNIYHWTGGYAVIALSIINIFIGFHLLEVYGKWRTVYIVIILCLAGLSILLEIVTWITWLSKKNRDPELEAPLGGGTNGQPQKLEDVTP